MKNFLVTTSLIAALLCNADTASANGKNHGNNGNHCGNSKGHSWFQHYWNKKNDCKKNKHHDNDCKNKKNNHDCKKHKKDCKKDKHCDNKKAPICDAGEPYFADAIPGVVFIELDGTGSENAQTYAWSTTQPGVTFDDPTDSQPVIAIEVGNECFIDFWVDLTVSNKKGSSTCRIQVKLRDNTPPVITCPENAKITCGADTTPESLGFPTVFDHCDPAPEVRYHDRIIQPLCEGARFDYIIERTWIARDSEDNVSECIQLIDVVKVVASGDIFPGQCPNLYSQTGDLLVPMAVLGSDTFDVTQIVQSTIKLWGIECSAGPVGPDSFELADVATPFFGGTQCDCHDLNGDGKLDLIVKFKRAQMNTRLGLGNYPTGTVLRLTLNGRLTSGCEFIAEDCIVLQ
jgi:hypothetical protein